MLLIRLIRFLRGIVIFTGCDGFPERFVNLCAHNGVPLWDVSRRSGVLTACTTVQGYRSIRPCARRSGMRLRIREKRGLRFFMHRYRKRVGMLVGFAAFAVLLVMLSGMVWSVQVEGNVLVPDEKIAGVFEQLGVRPGVRSKSIDVEAVRLAAAKDLPELSWMAVNLRGSSATIEVRERVAVPELADDAPSNICASFDGLITRLEAYSGEAMQKVGSAVVKGDLLISGVKQNKDESVSLYHAGGLVLAKTQRPMRSFVAYTQQVMRFTGKVKRQYALHFFGIRIPLGLHRAPRGQYLFHTEERLLTASGVQLPVSLQCDSYLEYEIIERELTKEEAQLEAAAQLMLEQAELLKNAEVLGGELTLTEAEGGCVLTGTAICQESIGVQTPIETEP